MFRLGFNIKTLQHGDYKLNIWDVGGQKSIRSYWRNYFEQTDGLIWVIDSADRRRLQDCKAELKELLQEEVFEVKGFGAFSKRFHFHKRLAGASLLVFANKQDLAGALTIEEIQEALELDSIATHHWIIQDCSAVTGANLVKGNPMNLFEDCLTSWFVRCKLVG